MSGRSKRVHSNLFHELIWILSDVKPNSAKFDSAITDLADIVFTSGGARRRGVRAS